MGSRCLGDTCPFQGEAGAPGRFLHCGVHQETIYGSSSCLRLAAHKEARPGAAGGCWLVLGKALQGAPPALGTSGVDRTSSSVSGCPPPPQGGCCPDLRLLEVNAEIKQSTQEFQLPIEQLQAACPQLQVRGGRSCPPPSQNLTSWLLGGGIGSRWEGGWSRGGVSHGLSIAVLSTPPVRRCCVCSTSPTTQSNRPARPPRPRASRSWRSCAWPPRPSPTWTTTCSGGF